MTNRNSHIAGIDGLRALAVVAVIVFHIDISLLPGGFAGVDIFYVISGYVVTSSIVAARYSGTALSFLAWFYRRRVVRIFPAAAVFIFSALLFSVFFIPITPLTKWIEPTGIAAYVGLSNFLLLWKAGDYFSSASAFHPFTHTWSLSVEEQFYLVFPLLLYASGAFFALGRPGKKANAILAFHLLTFASILLAIYLTDRYNAFAFYSLPTRFWELAVGVYTFFLLSSGKRELLAKFFQSTPGSCLAACGAVALCLLLAVSKEADFPFPGAVPVCILTSFVLIVVVVAPKALVGRVLGWRPIVYVGLISYSLYLWHWGVIVAMRWTTGISTVDQKLLAFFLTFALAVFSYYYVERPVRYSEYLRKLSSRQFFSTTAIVFLCFGCMSSALTLAKPQLGLAAANDSIIWSPYLIPDNLVETCGLNEDKRKFSGGDLIILQPGRTCKSNGRTLYVVGDSHAAAYTRMFAQYAASDANRVVILSMGGCRTLRGDDSPQMDACSQFTAAVFSYIQQHAAQADAVLISGFYGGRYWDVWADSDLDKTPLQVSKGDLTAEDPSLSNMSMRALESMRALKQLGLSIIIELPKPVAKSAQFRCVDWFNRDNPHCDHRPEMVDDFRSRTAGGLKLILAADRFLGGVEFWNPSIVLCNAESCPSQVDGKPVYFDADHLSGFGNELLYPLFSSLMAGIESRPVAVTK